MSPNQYSNNCQVCDSAYDDFRNCRRNGYQRCPFCGLVRAVVPPDCSAIIDIYESVDPVDYVSESRSTLYSDLLRKAELRTCSEKRLLDVGCSTGSFLGLAAAQGWQATGIEPATTLARQAISSGFDVFNGVLAQLPDDRGPFDLITYWDSFMLADNPAMELDRSLNRLADGGSIYLRLRQHGFQKFIFTVWRLAGKPLRWPNPSVYHPYNFTPKTIEILSNKRQLQVEISNSPFTEGDPYGTMRTKIVAGTVKLAMNIFANFSSLISGSRWIWSPGMDVWLQRSSRI